MKHITRSIGLLVIIAASLQAATVVPLPPFTVYGKVYNWTGRAFSSNDAATVVAKVNGVELDRCDLVSGVYPAVNFRVQIPMASGIMAGHAVMGTPIAFEVYYDGLMHAVAPGQTNVVVGQPASSLGCNLVVATDDDHNGLPDEYEALLRDYYLEIVSGLIPTNIPDDDLDQDGFSNLQEFYAGTSPVNSNDFLKIDSISIATNRHMALSFLSAPGRTYSLPHSFNLVSNSWNDAIFATSQNELPAHTFLSTEMDSYTTLFLLPTNNVFFRLKVQ